MNKLNRLIGVLVAIMMAAGTITPVPVVYGAGADANGSGDRYVSPVDDDARFSGDIVIYKDGSSVPECRYSDRWFTVSSFDLSRHVASLSSYAANTAGSYKPANSTAGAYDVKGLINDFGFTDVQVNKYYYERESKPDSTGCIAGHKKIRVGGRTYTLLAVFPVSPDYSQEWAGNLTVGKGSIHQGFKAARDECLRFLRNYISEHGITGDLKIWITGHSRFAAVSNLLAGFLAGGGEQYFDRVNIAAEDVYCYTYASPATIKTQSATKADALSVAGSRAAEEPRYKDDSDGEPYIYSGSDAAELVKPGRSIYKGIKNCRPDYDLITDLPPEEWGFGTYGVEFPISDGKRSTKASMLDNLKVLYPSIYEDYINGGDEEDYRWKKFDFAALEFVDDTECKDPITQAGMFRQRINDGLANQAGTTDEYVKGGYEAALVSLMGLFWMDKNGFMKGMGENMDPAVKAALFSYFAYAAERLEEEERYTEEKAIAVAIEEIIEYITGESIDPESFTVDDLLYLFAKYISDNAEYEIEKNDQAVPQGAPEDTGRYDGNEKVVKKLKFKSKTAQMVFETISNLIVSKLPENYRSYLPYIVPGYDASEDPDSENNKRAISEFVFSMLHQCAYGTGDDEDPAVIAQEAKSTRATLFLMAQTFMGTGSYKDIIDAMGKDDSGATDGSAYAKDFLSVLIQRFVLEGEKYHKVADAADEALEDLIEAVADYVLESGSFPEGSDQAAEYRGHADKLKEHAKQLREAVMDMLFTRKGESGSILTFDTVSNIRLVSTLASQANNILCAHLCGTYDSWMKAQDTTEVSSEELMTMLDIIRSEYDFWYAETASLLRKTEAELKRVEQLLKEADQAAADAVRKKIEDLPAAGDITLADSNNIIFARTFYEMLTSDQKKLITRETIKKLEDAEQALEAARKAEEEKTIPVTRVILTETTYKYDGKVHKPEVLLVIAGDIVAGTDGYDTEYSAKKPQDAGSYTVTVTGKGRFSGTAAASYKIRRAKNPVKVKAKKVTIKQVAVRRKAKKIRRRKAMTVTGAQGKVTYKLIKVSKASLKKYFKVSKNTGDITVKKGLKKGSCVLRIKVSTAGSKNYKAKTKAVNVKITVK